VNKVIFIWQRPLWEGNQEVVKRSGRDEPMWVATYKCMEATRNLSVELSLSQTSKKATSFLLSHVFSSRKLDNKRTEQVLPGSGEGVWGWHKQCIHM
jgi:hypothetical protein